MTPTAVFRSQLLGVDIVVLEVEHLGILAKMNLVLKVQEWETFHQLVSAAQVVPLQTHFIMEVIWCTRSSGA